MEALRVEHPAIQLVLTESVDPEALFRAVAAGELDVAFGSPTRAPAALETTTLLKDPYVLLVAANNQLAQEAALTPKKSPDSRSSVTAHPVRSSCRCHSCPIPNGTTSYSEPTTTRPYTHS